MSSANLQSLLSPARQLASDNARKINAMPVRQAISAMRIGYADSTDKELVYLEEVPIDFFSVPRTLVDANSTSHHWLRFEVSIDGKKNSVARKHEMLIAEHPYALKRVHNAPFKPGTTQEKLRPQVDQFDSLDAAMQWIDNLDRDYFHTGKELIAGFSQPKATLESSGRSRNMLKETLFVFGTCENFEVFQQQLYQSDTVQSLLRQTEQQSIRFAPGAQYDVQPKLPDELVDEGNALMFLSIRQALAGPHKDSKKWFGKPVTDKINQIYRDHLYNEWRRWKDRTAKEVNHDPEEKNV